MAQTERPPREDRERSSAARQVAFRFGLSAESRSAALLMAKGYRILARRFRTPVGEIDIVARRRGTLVFVEVKARDRFDDAAEAIGKRQQNRIIAAAQSWLAAHPDDAMSDMRFDVILVVPGRLPHHLLAAFDAST
jgi:putative endonuclease